jgi:hypothetical protein
MSRRSSMHTDEDDYHPLAIRFTKKDGTPKSCNLCCGLSSKDFILIIGCYTAFYSFLFGFSILLLRGAISTAETNSLLWAFLIVGIVFCVGVAVAVIIGTRTEQRRLSNQSKLSTTDEENP